MFEGLAEIAKEKNANLINRDILTETSIDVYDYITILNVLEHVQYPEEFLKKLRNSFKKSSLQLILIWDNSFIKTVKSIVELLDYQMLDRLCGPS